MVTVDVTDVFEELSSHRIAVQDGVERAVAEACVTAPALRHAVKQIFAADGSWATCFRLMPLAVHGAMTGDPSPAIPVAVMSTIWWTGAETLDDIADGQFDGESTELTAGQALTASSTCITLIPQVAANLYAPTTHIAGLWTEDLVSASLSSADGQIDDLASDGPVSWARTMVGYGGKSGAPYERDVVMTRRLVDGDEGAMRAWRAFGRLFGVLRQLANDAAGEGAVNEADLVNGARTLRLAHAIDMAGPDERDALAELMKAAAVDPAARDLLRQWLHRDGLLADYRRRVDVIQHQLSTLLAGLVPSSRYRDAIQWMINASADAARS